MNKQDMYLPKIVKTRMGPRRHWGFQTIRVAEPQKVRAYSLSLNTKVLQMGRTAE